MGDVLDDLDELVRHVKAFIDDIDELMLELLEHQTEQALCAENCLRGWLNKYGEYMCRFIEMKIQLSAAIVSSR